MTRNVILCVDDEKFVLNSVKTQLKEKYGSFFDYETADNANDALEIVDELMNDGPANVIIITDWLMPVIKGDELLVRVHEKYPEILKIMLTGHASREAIERSKKQANLYRCIPKPWTESDLIEAIDSGLTQF